MRKNNLRLLRHHVDIISRKRASAFVDKIKGAMKDKLQGPTAPSQVTQIAWVKGQGQQQGADVQKQHTGPDVSSQMHTSLPGAVPDHNYEPMEHVHHHPNFKSTLLANHHQTRRVHHDMN